MSLKTYLKKTLLWVGPMIWWGRLKSKERKQARKKEGLQENFVDSLCRTVLLMDHRESKSEGAKKPLTEKNSTRNNIIWREKRILNRIEGVKESPNMGMHRRIGVPPRLEYF